MLPTDTGKPTSGTLTRLSDPRVQQYWDAEHEIAQQMGKDARPPQPTPDCCTRKGILWDLMAIYEAGLEWTDKMPVAVFFNGPVVDVKDDLIAVLRKKSER